MNNPHDDLDDDAIEMLLRGEAPSPELRPLADAIKSIQQGPHRPVQPSPDLAKLMTTGDFKTASQRRRRWKILAGLSSLRLRTKIATVFVVALVSIAGLAAAGALPGSAQQRVEEIIETVTPFKVSGTDLDGEGSIGDDITGTDEKDAGDGDHNGRRITDPPDTRDEPTRRGNAKDPNHSKNSPGSTTTLEPEPTTKPTADAPTESPTDDPTRSPTSEPTEEPTAEPTEEPVSDPTPTPTATATPEPEPTGDPVLIELPGTTT